MANVSIPRRYARALLEVAGSNADPVLEQLNRLVALLQGNQELSDVVTNPAYTRSDRMGVIEGVLKAMSGLDASVENLVRLLVERNRLQYLGDIARLYRDFADAKAGRVRGKIRSAIPLEKDIATRLEQSLTKLTNRSVVLEEQVDPKLLAGVSAQVGPLLFDGSLRAQLDEMRRTLK